MDTPSGLLDAALGLWGDAEGARGAQEGPRHGMNEESRVIYTRKLRESVLDQCLQQIYSLKVVCSQSLI